MEIKNNISNFFNNPRTQALVALAIIFIVCILVFKNCGRTIVDNNITQTSQNLSNYKDSLFLTQNKLNQIEYQRTVLASSNASLQTLASNLQTEVEKEKGTVIYLSQIITSLQSEVKDTMHSVLKIWPNGENSIYYSYDTNYGNSNSKCFYEEIKFGFKDTLIDRNSIKIDIKESFKFNIITGLSQDKDNLLKIFVRSDYPGFEISSLNGAIIDPQKSDLIKSYFPRKRFGIGFHLGYGINTNFNIAPYIGIGISYNLINF